VAGCQSLPFSIDFDRRPYNTLALPCECVISLISFATPAKGHFLTDVISNGRLKFREISPILGTPLRGMSS